MELGSQNIAKSSNKHVWFPGLNALRLFAASLVVIMHIHSNQGVSHLLQLPDYQILFKGLYAVSFFFVLSGFLITYLLLQERKKTGTISIKAFYLRRVFRIWPLYFIVVAIGMVFYWILVPKLGLAYEDTYPHGLAVVLFAFFLSNLMNSFYHLGGILHVTWSIAVEEQFYLFWAPLVKKFKNHLILVILIVTALSLILNFLNTLNVFGLSFGWQLFINTLQFHYMGIGAAFAWLLYTRKEKLVNLIFFRNKIVQAILVFAIIGFLFFYKKSMVGELITPIPIGLLFGWLIVNVSSNPSRIFSLDNKFLNYGGKVSYGIYMYHMPVVYAVTFLFTKMKFLANIPLAYFSIYYCVCFAITIGIASLSYYLIETPILKLNKPKNQKPSVAVSVSQS